MREGKYRSLAAMEKDLVLMCRNAKQFNEPGSTIYKAFYRSIDFLLRQSYRTLLSS